MAQEHTKAPLADKPFQADQTTNPGRTQGAHANGVPPPAQGRDESKAAQKPQPATYICDICGQEGLSEWQMRSHVLIEHIEGQISCPFCDLEGTTLEEMTLHVNSQHLDFLTPATGQQLLDAERKEGALRIEDCKDTDANVENASSNGEISLYDNVSKSFSESSESFSVKYSSESSQHDVTTGVPSPMEITVTEPKESPRMHQPEQTYPSGSLKRAKLSLQVPSAASTTSFTGSTQGDVNHNDVDCGGDAADVYSCPLCGWSTVSSSDITAHVNIAHLDAVTPTKSVTRAAYTDTANQNNNLTSLTAENKLSGHLSDPDDPLVDSPERVNGEVLDNAPSKGVVGDQTSPASKDVMECPLCGWSSVSGAAVELHVNTQHGDILSPPTSQGQTPVSVGSGSAGSPSLLCPVCGMGCYDTISLQNHVDGHFSAQQTPGKQQLNDRLTAKKNLNFIFQQIV